MVNQKSKANGRLDRLNLRVPPEQSGNIWYVPASFSSRTICPFWLEVLIMVKRPIGLPLRVSALAKNCPADANGPALKPSVEKIQLPARARSGLPPHPC